MPEVWQGWISDIEATDGFRKPLPLMNPRHIQQDYTAREITEIVAETTGVSLDAIMSESHARRFAFPRHVAWFLIHRQCNRRLSEIARTFNRDRSTVEQALRNFSHRIQRHPELGELLERCEAALT